MQNPDEHSTGPDLPAGNADHVPPAAGSGADTNTTMLRRIKAILFKRTDKADLSRPDFPVDLGTPAGQPTPVPWSDAVPLEATAPFVTGIPTRAEDEQTPEMATTPAFEDQEHVPSPEDKDATTDPDQEVPSSAGELVETLPEEVPTEDAEAEASADFFVDDDGAQSAEPAATSGDTLANEDADETAAETAEESEEVTAEESGVTTAVEAVELAEATPEPAAATAPTPMILGPSHPLGPPPPPPGGTHPQTEATTGAAPATAPAGQPVIGVIAEEQPEEANANLPRTAPWVETLRLKAVGLGQWSDDLVTKVRQRVEVADQGKKAVDPTRRALTFAAVLAVVGLILSVWTLTRPVPTKVAGSAASPAPSISKPANPKPPPSPATTGAPKILATAVLDPFGDNKEHPEQEHAMSDGDPESKWSSRYFRDSKFGMKPGIGVAITLVNPAQLSEVLINTPCVGGQWELRNTSPDDPNGGTVLASGTFAQPDTTIKLTSPVSTSVVVLWITELPRDKEQKNRIQISEITVR